MYSVASHKDGFYILSNHNAKNGKLLFSKEFPESLNSCSVYLKHDPKVLLEDIQAFKNHLIVMKVLIEKLVKFYGQPLDVI